MEQVEGVDLFTLLQSGGPLTAEHARLGFPSFRGFRLAGGREPRIHDDFSSSLQLPCAEMNIFV